jgi:hypothetical protein
MIAGEIMAVDNHVAYFEVHAIQDAKSDDLKKLGLSLSELCIKFPAIKVTGIDELLTGNYPQHIETIFWIGKYQILLMEKLMKALFLHLGSIASLA